MPLSLSLPPEVLRVEVEDDLSRATVFIENRPMTAIDDPGNGLVSPTVDDILTKLSPLAERYYSTEIKPKMLARVEEVYNTRAKSAPYTHTDGTVYPMRFKTVSVLKSLVDMAQLLGNTTVDFADIDGVPHTYTIADANTLMLSMGAALNGLYMEKLAVVTAIKADTDGSGWTTYQNYLDKYIPRLMA